ncbi:MAG: hypothetical protein ABSF35_16615 [Polyangia bacterium]
MISAARLLLGAFLVLVLFASEAAHAQTLPAAPPAADAPWGNGRSVIAVNSGIASAVGFAGLTYAYSPLSWLETEVGFGQGFSGTQFSAMQKLTVGGPMTHFIAGVGFAYTVGKGVDSAYRPPYWWLNIDIAGLEVRTKSHFDFFIAAGLTREFERPIAVMDNDPGGNTFPQLRMGIGGWF